jgi:alginate O-acetyltransferase complex protein AlgI
MGFHSVFFLFLFLPIYLIISLLPGKKVRGAIMLVLSLIYVFLLESAAFPLFIGMLVFTYLMALGLSSSIVKEQKHKWWMWLGVGINLAILIVLKILVARGEFPVMPAGYSFFAFTAIAYLLDIYKRRNKAEKNIFLFANFLLFFPKLMAGPITRWKSFAQDAHKERVTINEKTAGLKRFIVGLAKKVLIANQLGTILDAGIFQQQVPLVTTPTAWMMLLFYGIQLYYDFAGYTDMAIGLAKMVGIDLPENFDLPYISRSITEFWRRWHITLSSWFRDYVFMPLEWKRRKWKWLKQSMNTLLIFLLTGLWHGFSLNFVIWGMLHGIFAALENSNGLSSKIKQLPTWLQHLYTMLVVFIAWVFFRSPTTTFALGWLKALVGFGTRVNLVGYSVLPHIGSTTWLAFIIGVVLATPLLKGLKDQLANNQRYAFSAQLAQHCAYLILLISSIVVAATSSYLPTIYGNF